MKRNVTYRLLPESRSRAQRLAAVAGACRFVWNHFLAENHEAMAAWKEGQGEKPTTSFFTLGKQFTALRRETPWLQSMPFAPVRYALKYQSDAWKAYFEGRSARPRFHARSRGDSVTLPSGTVRIVKGALVVPRAGAMRLRRRGGNPLPRCNTRPGGHHQAPGKVVCHRLLRGRRGATIGQRQGAGHRHERAPDHHALRHDAHGAEPRTPRGEETTLPADDGAPRQGLAPTGPGTASGGKDPPQNRPRAPRMAPPGDAHACRLGRPHRHRGPEDQGNDCPQRRERSTRPARA